MSDAKTIAALQRNLADAEVERLRLVERVAEIARVHEAYVVDHREVLLAMKAERDSLREELAASHLAAQRMATEAVAEERERITRIILTRNVKNWTPEALAREFAR